VIRTFFSVNGGVNRMSQHDSTTGQLVRKHLALILLPAFFSACAAMEANQAVETEQLLAAAGFQIKLAQSPAQLAHVKTLTQHKLVPHEKDGGVYYVYADATTCKCVYWGNEASYQRYQQLAVQREIADDQRMAAQMNENAAMNWGMWGAGPWWVY
jgi:uncharacterized protein YdbL (DUF1318 family)